MNVGRFRVSECDDDDDARLSARLINLKIRVPSYLASSPRKSRIPLTTKPAATPHPLDLTDIPQMPHDTVEPCVFIKYTREFRPAVAKCVSRRPPLAPRSVSKQLNGHPSAALRGLESDDIPKITHKPMEPYIFIMGVRGTV